MNMALCTADHAPGGQQVAAPFPAAAAGKSGWPWQTGAGLATVASDADGWPRISVITPSFNQARYLEQALRSVLLQGYPNLEYIVIDGGSSDGSREILDRYSTWIDFWVSEADHGQTHALNKGFACATGEWLTWLNSDDLFLPGSLWTIAEAIRKQPSADWVVGTVVVTDANLRPVRRFEPVCNSDDWLDFLCTKRSTGTSLPQPGNCWSRRAWETAGPLDETLRYVMDYEYWARLARCGYRPLPIAAELAMFRLSADSKSGSGMGKFIREEQVVVTRYLREGKVEKPLLALIYKIFLREIWWYRRARNRLRDIFFASLSRGPVAGG